MVLFSKNGRLLAALLVGLLGIAGPALAQTNISNSPNWHSSCPRITVDPTGNVHVIWAEFYGMSGPYPTSGDAFYARLNIATGQWTTPVNLSNSGGCFSGEWLVVGIDSDASGNVYAVYVDGATIKLRILSGGAWSAPFTVGTAAGEVDGARVAVTPAGDIFICWYEAGPGLVRARARVGGTWESAANVSTYGYRAKFPEIAVGANLVYCVWQDGSSGWRYFAAYAVRAKTFGASWSALKRVSSGTDTEEHPAIKVDASDVAHVVYTPQFDDGSRCVRYASGTSAGFGTPVNISSLGVHYPSLGLKGSNLYAVWKWDYGKVYTNERKGGVWSGESAVPGSGSPELPDVAITASQDKVYYVWDTGSPRDIYVGVKTQYVAPTVPSKHAIGDFDGDKQDEVAVDFGASGVWLADATGWLKISSSNPDGLMAARVPGGAKDEIVADFGSLGLWVMVDGAWHLISSKNPEAVIRGKIGSAAGDSLFVDFGTSGLWSWNGYSWSQLSGANPVSFAAGDVDADGTDELVCGFASVGLWLWNAGSWSQLSGLTPEFLTCGNMDGSGGEEVVADFGATGVWVRNAGTWIRLSPADAEELVFADADGNGVKELLGDFGIWGLYLWINNGWVGVTAYNPDLVIAADMDGDGRDEIVADFGSVGLWLGDELNWSALSHANAENLMAGDADGNGTYEILVDFGPFGLWGWYVGGWYQLSAMNPD